MSEEITQAEYKFLVRKLARETGKSKSDCRQIVAKSLGYKNENEFVNHMKSKGLWGRRGTYE